ncbi:hypothetical protein WAK64_08425 [Bacillus spongiae]|uniref:Uncharacterized protein n=1 Tax=Bacillus spongiae TaxID=2683610 RepID=A0ABU8HCX8_9BACI
MKISDINFSYFIGQKVNEVNTDESHPFGIRFEGGGLIVECPWRIRRGNSILIGTSDCKYAPEKFSHHTVEKLLKKKAIEAITFYEEFSIFIIKFEENVSLEMFHDSSYFEGWQLTGDNNFDLISLPGGNIS